MSAMQNRAVVAVGPYDQVAFPGAAHRRQSLLKLNPGSASPSDRPRPSSAGSLRADSLGGQLLATLPLSSERDH